MAKVDVERIKLELARCRRQHDQVTRLNTAGRKEMLKEQIVRLEAELAEAYGISDDDDESNNPPFGHSQKNTHNYITPSTDSMTSSPSSLNSSTPANDSSTSSILGTRPPSPTPTHDNSSVKRMRLYGESPTPPKNSSLSSSTNSPSEPSTSTPQEQVQVDYSTDPIQDDDMQAIARLLSEDAKDMGMNTDLSVQDLFKAAAEHEERTMYLKKKRLEEDEQMARALQEEENLSSTSAGRRPYNNINNNNNHTQLQSSLSLSNPGSLIKPSKVDSNTPALKVESTLAKTSAFSVGSSAGTAGSSSSPSSTSTADLAKKRQEAIDAELAKMFEQEEIFDTTEPNPPLIRKDESTNSKVQQQVAKAFPGATSSVSAVVNTTTSVLNHAMNSLTTQQQSILHGVQQQRAGPSGPSFITAASLSRSLAFVDLTSGKGSAIDLTRPKVYEIPSSDSEDHQEISSGSESEESDSDEEGDKAIMQQIINNSMYSMGSFSYPGQGGYGGYGDYARHLSAQDTEKELRDLLANIQSHDEVIKPEDRTGTPEGMHHTIALLEHQKIGLSWLQKMEDGTNKGGILGDDMGLGKTIQSLALIVSRPAPEPATAPKPFNESKAWFDTPPSKELAQTGITLIVAPVALVYQWELETNTKTVEGLLKVYIYHGPNRNKSVRELRRNDVIITTYNTLALEQGYKDPVNKEKNREVGPLFKMKYHRIILDEAHLIKNRVTKASVAMTKLESTFRWCLTGTPIQNNIDELYSLIRFLRIKPYCEWDEFRSKISNPLKRSSTYTGVMQRVQALMSAICLRRTKTSTVDGKPILELPARNVQKVEAFFSEEERAFYTALETRTRDRFNAYLKAGTVMKNYSNILVLLLRLRQACCHPHLIKDIALAADEFDDDEEDDASRGGGSRRMTAADKQARAMKLLDKMVDAVVTRLKARGEDAAECPICMDVSESPVIIANCGHIYCRECIEAHLQRSEGEDGKCPECRGKARKDELIPLADFNAKHLPAPPAAEQDADATDGDTEAARAKDKGKGKAVATNDDPEGSSSTQADRNVVLSVPEELDQWISSSKIDRMIEIVRDAMAKGEKVIVFSQFTALLDIISKPLKKDGIKYLRYDGKMSAGARNEACTKMMTDPEYPVMLISLKCGSLGLNLVAANHVVIMDPWWNPALENQAIDRVHRIGQRKDVFVHRLCIANSVEDRILALQDKKKALADGALGEGAIGKLPKLGLQELMFLFRG